MVGVVSAEVVPRIETLSFTPANSAAIDDPTCRLGGAVAAICSADQCDDAIQTINLQRGCKREFLIASAQPIAAERNRCLASRDDASGSPNRPRMINFFGDCGMSHG